MEIGIVGLGKMGYNLALNLRDNGHEVFAFNRSKEAIMKIRDEGIAGVESLEELVDRLSGRRIIWIMVPAGPAVDDILVRLSELLGPGDILIDGGNSHYKDTLRRCEMLQQKKIEFVDIGTSGGISGARNGACTMVGATDEVFSYIEPIISDISVENGCLHTGGNGSGHYVKMVHNGIEYGMMQSLGEGFELLQAGPFDLDYEKVADVWSNGSVIRGWLMELTASLFSENPDLESLKGIVDSSGEGLWSVQEALDLKVPAPVIAMSLFTRFSSKQEDSFSNKVVAGLRNQFGGHSVTEK